MSDFEVRDWVVLECSPYHAKANEDKLVLSTLPGVVDSRRASTKPSVPQPIGVLRLLGSSPSKVDVKLDIHNGRPMAEWPPAKAKTEHILWNNLQLSAGLPTTDSMEGARGLTTLAEGNWLNELRSADSAYLRNDAGTERFLLYDVEVDYVSPLKIKGGEDFTYDLVNTSTTPLRELALYKRDGSGWRTASGPLLGGPATTKPSTQASSMPAATMPATTQATTATTLRLNSSPATQPADVLAPWKATLARDGILPADTEVILNILEQNALDPTRLTAVYELDAGELDRLLPLEVIPEPRKISRLGLVILKDSDPGVAGEIDRLIAQLGSDDWATRDAASAALAKLGKAAKSQLEKATANKDVEVAWRVERLLAALADKKPQPNE